MENWRYHVVVTIQSITSLIGDCKSQTTAATLGLVQERRRGLQQRALEQFETPTGRVV